MKRKPESLREWQEMFGEIYGRKNLALSPAECFLRLVKEVGDLAEALRREEKREIKNYLASAFAWLCGLYGRLKIDMEKSIWNRFPGICPYCGKPHFSSCVIVSKEKKISPTFIEYCRRTNKKPTSLDKWQRLFKRIYGPINKITT